MARGLELADYAISVGDELQMDFLDDEDEPYLLAVGGKGAVQLPFIGALDVAGLSLTAARDRIAETYVERDILLAPQLELSVVNLRPVSVVGDVREPGFFDYRPYLSVEQAVGLAGGAVRPGENEEGRALQRASLRGERARIEAALAREAVAAARLGVQIEQGERIDVAALEGEEIDDSDGGLVEVLVARENEVIFAERGHFVSETSLLDQAILEAGSQIGLIDEEIVAQTAQIASYDAELLTSADLVDRGLVALPVHARLLRQVADEETALLRLRTNLAAARLQLTALRRQQLDVAYERRQSWLREVPEVDLRRTQLRTERASVLDRLAVLDDRFARAAGAQARDDAVVTVRRRTPDGGRTTLDAGATDELLPGDVVIVRVADADRSAQGAAQPAEGAFR